MALGNGYDESGPVSVAWTTELEDRPARARPILIGDTIVVHGRDGTVTGIDLRNGTIEWTLDGHETSQSYVPVAASAVEGLAYAWAGDHVTAIDPADGGVAWRSETVDGVDPDLASVPLRADGDLLYAGADRPTAFDAGSGDLLWRHDSFETFGVPYFTPTFEGDHLYVPTDEGIVVLERATGDERILATDPTTDEEIVAYPPELHNLTRPVVTDEYVIVLAHGEGMYAYDRLSTRPQWEVADSYYWGHVLRDGIVYASTYRTVKGLSIEDGFEAVAYDTGDRAPNGVPVLDGSSIYVGTGGSDGGAIFSFDAASRDTNWRVTTPSDVRTAPIVAGDRVVAATEGEIFALTEE
ncbi:outer membrane protein assembly factor BamB family protein [Halopiger goleimassiliensis]|uniref:outer membrane protein assembly factor BamB family protein n=1 Tax=Halopiger goleimassiliensis TaxID=1293048 RepID=UPI000677C5AE|nr:PQQ-binding-like beta-propeller repeat protein [Halopiger goleimassiliensis]